MSKDPYKSKSEIFQDVKNFAEEIVLNSPERAKNAIRDRNIIIRSLKSINNHREIAFDEIETRYNQMALDLEKQKQKSKDLVINIDEVDLKLKTCNELINKKDELIEELTKLNREKSDEIFKLNSEINYSLKEKRNTWTGKIEKFSNKLPSWPKFLTKVFLTPPGVIYLTMAIFFILLLASIVGWAPLFELFTFFKSLFISG